MEQITVGWLRETYGTFAFHAKVRAWARVAHTGPKACRVCGHTTHVQVSHITPVTEFGPQATMNEVNDPRNLVALCPNHHWEFDHGHLDRGSIIGAE